MSPGTVQEPGLDSGAESLSLLSAYETVPCADVVEPQSRPELSADVTRKLVGGTSALGLGIVIERGTGFLANILAARYGGASTFGAYSLAISTANQISTYAAGGIGATAARFSGKYSFSSGSYSRLARALAIVSLVSAVLAAAGLWFGAAPIAHLLGKPQLTGLLRWAAISASGIILLECARGFFVGQRRLTALILLSVLVGGGMITLLPAAAKRHSPVHMIVTQGAITLAAVGICLIFSRRLGLHAPKSSALHGAVGSADPAHGPAASLGAMLREVWSFGFVQLAGLLGSNLAGWWLMTLVARSDTTLVQMSFFAIASQLRNLAGIAPSLLTEGSYAVMADPQGEASRTPHRVMALCSFASLGVALLLASVGIVLVPWALSLLYGKTYAAAGLTVAVALAIAVVHMGNAPAAARLTIVSIRATGVINTVWAIFVAVAASLLLFHGGSAWQAMAIYFAGHILSSVLVLLTLARKDHVPAGMSALFGWSAGLSTALIVLAFLRVNHPAQTAAITGLMTMITILGLAGFVQFGRHYRWLPTADAIHSIVAGVLARLGMGRQAHV